MGQNNYISRMAWKVTILLISAPSKATISYWCAVLKHGRTDRKNAEHSGYPKWGCYDEKHQTGPQNDFEQP